MTNSEKRKNSSYSTDDAKIAPVKAAYSEPILEIVEFEANDIITTSSLDQNAWEENT